MSIRFLPLTVAPPLAGVALGYLLGGRLAGFRQVRIRALWLLWAAAAVQFVQFAADLAFLTSLALLLYTVGAPYEHGG